MGESNPEIRRSDGSYRHGVRLSQRHPVLALCPTAKRFGPNQRSSGDTMDLAALFHASATAQKPARRWIDRSTFDRMQNGEAAREAGVILMSWGCVFGLILIFPDILLRLWGNRPGDSSHILAMPAPVKLLRDGLWVVLQSRGKFHRAVGSRSVD